MLFFFIGIVSGVEIVVSSGIHKEKPYSVVNIINDTDFKCINLANAKKPKNRFLCAFDKIPLKYPLKSENNFFSIKPFIKDEKLYILITPKTKSLLKTYGKRKNHWIILAYTDKVPFIIESAKTKEGINFKINIKNKKPYFVGSLDVDKKPFVNKKRKKEIKDFLKTQKMYKEKKYDDVLRIANRVVEKNPDSIFLPEILVYKIRTLDDQKKYMELLEVSEPWIETYTTHKDLPEVMLLSAKAYLKVGNTKKADYYIDVLIRDYKKSIYSQLATIYKADRLKNMIKESEAMILYRRVLDNTKNIEVASIAANKLAELLLKYDKVEEGINYYKKIYSANPNFFVKENPIKAYDLAIVMTRYKEIGFCAALSDLTLSKITKDHDDYKKILIASARWHAKAGEIQKAKQKYEQFFKEFPYDDMEKELKEEYDKLFFETNDMKFDEKIKKYDELIAKYPDDEIGIRAFYEKIMLLAKHNQFDKIKNKMGEFMSLSKSYFPDIDIESRQIINNMFFYYLMADDCKSVVDIYKNYEVNIDLIYDEKIYNCMIKEYEYNLADQLADNNIYKSSGYFTIKWLGKKVDIYSKTSNFKKAVDVGDDYLKSMKLFGKNVSYKRYKEIIMANYMQKNFLKVLELTKEIEELFPKKLDIVQMYKIAIKSAKEIDDIKNILHYAKKIYDYQKRTKSSAFSPWVELEFANALMKTKKYSQAINILQEVAQNKKLSKKDKVRVLYELSSALDTQGYFALSKRVLQECVKIKTKSTYKKLCEDGLKIYQ